MSLIQKGVCLMLFLAVVFLAGVCWVNKRTIDVLAERNEELNGTLKAIDLQAKKDAIIYKENANAIKNKHINTVANLNSKYDRLLQASNNSSASNTSDSAEGVNGSTKESSINFERNCALDANHVILFQEWVLINKFPISE